ncbi:MAG TPA: hypothetical protein VID70_07575 [Solirubrobacteraceae bacterium]
MSTKLHLPRRERRPRRARRAARSGTPQTTQISQAQPAQAAQPVQARKPAQETQATGSMDVAAHKVREAGGPIDLASYVCLCGFAFAAAVSTSVACPHCGEPQAW